MKSVYFLHNVLSDGVLHCRSSDGDEESPSLLCDGVLHSSFSQFL